MTDIRLRPATSDDAVLILALLKELAVYEKLQDRFWLTEEAIRRDMLGAVCHCDLVFVDGEGAGIATWLWIYKSFRGKRGLYVEDLYVKPDHRGRGLGKQLLKHLAIRAEAAGGFMEWRVLDWNTPAIEFYKSLGAHLIPEWIDCRLEGEALKRLAQS